jgi:predicted secreted protein
MSRFASLIVIALLPVFTAAAPATAADDTPRYNQIHFQVERSRPVDNDRMHAVLSYTAEDDDAARLADQVNRAMDGALKTARAKPGIEVRTGGYRTWPVYDKNKIRRWRATQELLLEGADFAVLGNLIGQLQEHLQVGSINFSVSPARRAAVEDELIAQALTAFKQRAELVRKQFAAKGYRLVNVAINSGGQPVPLMRGMAMEAAMDKAVAPPALEAGTSTLSVNAGGMIELQ